MIVFDIETLSIDDTAKVLSFAAVYFDPEKGFTYDELLQKGFFVKLKLSQQSKRTASESTVDWWAKQHKEVQRASLFPCSLDTNIDEAHGMFSSWMHGNKFDWNKGFIWTRGSMDDRVFNHLCVENNLPILIPYNRVRDVRTAVDVLYGSTNGYVETSLKIPHVMKHHPLHDAALDAAMLTYGVKVET